MCAATTGAVVGAVVPPARSTVAATTAPLGTVPRRCTTLVPPPAKRPAGRASPPAGITHASYVFPCGARARPETVSVAWRSAPRTTTARTASVFVERPAPQTPRPTAAQAATAAAAAATRKAQGRRGKGTTF